MKAVFVSPHDDDHALFGAFTCLEHNPILVVVFNGYVQLERGLSVRPEQRAEETAAAACILNCPQIVRLGFRDNDPTVTPSQVDAMIDEMVGPHVDQWFLPADEAGGHKQHNLVAQIVPVKGETTRYLTYTERGKSTGPNVVPIRSGAWIQKKLLALAQYSSQMSMDPRMGCYQHFLRSQEEYYL